MEPTPRVAVSGISRLIRILSDLKPSAIIHEASHFTVNGGSKLPIYCVFVDRETDVTP
jgi:hypothetical protein